MFVCIKEIRPDRGNLSFSLLICSFISLHLAGEAAQFKAGLSGRLSQAICRSTAEYSTSKRIQGPLEDSLKFKAGSNPACAVVKWATSCESKNTCATFECSPSLLRGAKSSRIVGGTDALPNEFPHQVYFKRFAVITSFLFCGGSILNEKYVLSAAHCFQGSYVEFDSVHAGAHNVDVASGTEQMRKLKKVIAHEDFDPDKGINDIALVEVETPFDLTDDHVQPALLPKPNYVATGDAIATGWGKLSSGGDNPDILQKVTVPILTYAECVEAYKDADTENMELTSNNMCAGFLGDEGKGVCQGDSGGPLSVKLENGSYLLIGIVSWGIGCAEAKYPGIYTDVVKYLDWIGRNAV